MIKATLPTTILVALLLALTGCGQSSDTAPVADQASADDTAEKLDTLFAEYDEEFLALNPIFATFRGDNRYNDQWGPHDFLSDEYAAASLDIDTRYLAGLLEIEPSGLNPQDRSNYEIFKLDRTNAIERHNEGINAFEGLTPVSQFGSVPSFVVLLGSGANAQPFKTPEDYDNWISRSSGMTQHIDLTIARMREGVELGVVQPRILMEKALPQLAAQVVDSLEESSFWKPIEMIPEDFSDDDRERITAAYRDHISNTLIPAYAKLHEYIEDEYLQHGRESIGQSDVPGGADYYAFRVSDVVNFLRRITRRG